MGSNLVPAPRPEGRQAERRYPELAARGSCGATSHPLGQGEQRPGGQGGGQEEQAHAQGVVAVRAAGGPEEPSHQARRSEAEEIPFIQGKGVKALAHAQGGRETQVRW